VSENKSEMCDSTISEVEIINKRIHHTKRELHCKTYEDVFSNPLISTSSVVSHDVQVSHASYKDMAALNTATQHETFEIVATVVSQFIAAQNMNHDNDGGRNSEMHSVIVTLSPNLKGNENNSGLNLQNKVVSKCDDPLVSIGIDHTQKIFADLIDPHVHTNAESLQVDNHYLIMHGHY
jgi:hypothetical protein